MEVALKINKLSKVIAFSALSTAGIYFLNNHINERAVSRHLLETKSENYYKWKNLNVYYTQKGTLGSPVILLHNLNPAFSSVEWYKIEDLLAKNHRVYSIDLLGCGRSDKPELTYTNFYFVQLLIDFIKSRICEKTFVVASGYSSSIALMASAYDATKFSGLLFINPPSLGKLSQVPTKKSKIAKKILELPLIGSLVYNNIFAREAIDNKLIEKYLYNPFLIESNYTDSFYEGAHLGNGNGRFLQASLSGNYINMNIEHALKNTPVYADILIGSAEKDSNFISRTWKRLKPDMRIYSIQQAYALPHFEQPDLTVSIIEKSIQSAFKKRMDSLHKKNK